MPMRAAQFQAARRAATSFFKVAGLSGRPRYICFDLDSTCRWRSASERDWTGKASPRVRSKRPSCTPVVFRLLASNELCPWVSEVALPERAEAEPRRDGLVGLGGAA